MRRTVCDRCRCEIRPFEGYRLSVSEGEPVNELFDLCRNCFGPFVDFLANRTVPASPKFC